MKCVYAERHPERYVTNVRYHEMNRQLLWDAGKGHDTLIVRASYDADDSFFDLKEIWSKLERLEDLTPGSFIPLDDGVAVYLLKELDRLKQNAFEVGKGVHKYGIFACTYSSTGELELYPPLDGQRHLIKTELVVDVSLATERVKIGRLFRKKTLDFNVITFESPSVVSLDDGDLVWVAEDLRVPLSKAALRYGKMYCRGDIKPLVESSRLGVVVNMKS